MTAAAGKCISSYSSCGRIRLSSVLSFSHFILSLVLEYNNHPPSKYYFAASRERLV